MISLAVLLLAAPPTTPATPATDWAEQFKEIEALRLGDNASIRLSALIKPGKPTAVAFFATYCPPCIEEMPILNELHADGYAVAGVSLDSGNEAELRTLLKKQAVRYPVALLTEAALKSTGRILDGLPMTIIFGPKGSVAQIIRGKADRKALVGALKP